ncbi:hypothetical protein GUJ93_ZPchr0002g24394 [Zizania palustris]|uniref:Uncharacterized protein n=1 Tax=Zizania palustris TaxID=103762 RepID=A0A8J5VCR9_ZIZPA|nr:hypothetical protein GUJ93_ZPchr0002g24394 [Zizania palustris]
MAVRRSRPARAGLRRATPSLSVSIYLVLGFSAPYLRCVGPLRARSALRKASSHVEATLEDGTESGSGVEETLKAIMKRLDAIEERLLPIQSLEERARTAGTGTSAKQTAERWTVTWDRIRHRAAKEEGGRTQTSRRTARAESGRALSRHRATREEGGETFTELPPTVTTARGTCRRATGEGGARTLTGPPQTRARRDTAIGRRSTAQRGTAAIWCVGCCFPA